MTVTADKIVDLVLSVPREQAIDLVEHWARVRAHEATIAAGYQTLDQMMEMFRRPQPKDASRADA